MKLKTISTVFLCITLILISQTSFAQEENAFSGTGEVGLLMTSGNSETDSVNAKANLKYEKEHFLGEVNLAAVYSSEKTEVDGVKEDKVSAEKYNYSAKAGYKFNPANYVFLNADYEDDRFSGYDYRSTYSAGYGRKVIATDTVKLDIEIGPGYRYDQPNIGDTEDEAVFRGFVTFAYKFSDAASFQQDLTVVTGSSNTNTKSVTSLKSKIAGALSMKVSFKVDNNTDVPPDKKKTDTETALTLVYDF